MLSLYCLGGLVCVILHGLSTLARGHFAMDSSKRKAGRPKKKPRGSPANPDVNQKLPKNQREQQRMRMNKRKSIIHASPLRKRREEKTFDVGEVVNGDEFE